MRISEERLEILRCCESLFSLGKILCKSCLTTQQEGDLRLNPIPPTISIKEEEETNVQVIIPEVELGSSSDDPSQTRRRELGLKGGGEEDQLASLPTFFGSSPSSSSIQILDLSGNSLSDENLGVDILSSIPSHLLCLNLSHNQIGERCLSSLVNHPSLQHLDLSFNKMQKEEGRFISYY